MVVARWSLGLSKASSMPVTVMVWGWFQLLGVKVSSLSLMVATFWSLLVRLRVTSWVGLVFRTIV